MRTSEKNIQTGSLHALWKLLIQRVMSWSIPMSRSSIPLFVQGFPELFLELVEAGLGDGGDEDVRDVRRQFLLDLLPFFFVNEVRLRDGEDAVLHEQFGIVFLEFAEQDVVGFRDVRLVGGDHEQEHGVPFDVPEEARADAAALVRAFDDAGDVGHHERTVVIVLDDAQVRLQGGEGVVRDLGLGRCDGGEEGGLAGVGEAHEADIGQHFQFQDEPERNYDPDDDGLYDAYCCIWASDALYYNSGAVTHSSAYNYRGFTLAARIAEILGEDPTYYQQEAAKTLKGMNEQLWLKHRGHWAEYKDFMGLRRTHDHAALWSIYTPIDCGAATEEMAFRATQYVDSCIPHIPIVMTEKTHKALQLQTISTTDWLPYDWSINNVAAAEVMHMALAYFEAGRSEEGYRLVKANIMDQAYLGDSPGNFGQISYYDKARGELYRDFSDNTGISARTFIQGLYGIVPDALHGRCILRPGFPAEWKHASISTPYFKYSFRREGNKEIYEIEQNFAHPLQIVLRQNTGYGYVETLGTSEKKQTIIVSRAKRQTAPKPLLTAERFDGKAWGNGFDDVKTDRLWPVDISSQFNSRVSDIFKNFYLSPRSPYTTLQIPVHGIGEWCHPEMMATIDDSALREREKDGLLTVGIGDGIPFMYPKTGRNIVYTSLWDNYPDTVSITLSGAASHAYLLMAGSTNHMQSHIDNGLITVTYTDGTTDKLPLRNPHNWCPIEQDYYEDGLAFHAAQPRPYRIDFASAIVSRELMPMGEHYGRQAATGVAASYYDRNFERGAGIILDMPLNSQKTLRSLTVSTLSNDVVIGLMGITLQRPANISMQKK